MLDGGCKRTSAFQIWHMDYFSLSLSLHLYLSSPPLHFLLKLTFVSFVNSLLSGSFLIKFSSLSAPTKIEELAAGSDEKTQRSPAGSRTQGLANSSRTLYTTELRSHNGNCVRLSPSRQFFFHYEVTRIARVYKHAATNDNSLDLDPFNRKRVLVGIIPNQFSSLSAPTKLVILGRCVLVDSGNPGHLVVEKELTGW